MKYIRTILTYLIRLALRVFCLVPIRKNRVVFNSMFWKQYSCNPKYVTEYLLAHYPGKFEIIWCFVDSNAHKELLQKGIKLCKARSLKAFYYHMTAAVIVCNATIGAEIPPRRHQYRINTWHGGGGGYKRIDYTNAFKQRARLECRDTDLFCCSSETSLKNTVRDAFQHKGAFFKGTPRNDMLINQDRSDLRAEVHRWLCLPDDEHILLYAPTYREGKDVRNYDKDRYDYGLDYLRLQRCMEQRFGGSWTVAVRFHPRVVNYHLPHHEKIVDATKYPDMQELLASVDAMITDYSSSLWDFSFTNKPCALFCEDLDEYIAKRGFNKPIKEWGFPIAKSNDELEQIILNWDEQAHIVRMYEQHKNNGSFEDGTATKRLSELIYQKCFGKEE